MAEQKWEYKVYCAGSSKEKATSESIQNSLNAVASQGYEYITTVNTFQALTDGGYSNSVMFGVQPVVAQSFMVFRRPYYKPTPKINANAEEIDRESTRIARKVAAELGVPCLV